MYLQILLGGLLFLHVPFRELQSLFLALLQLRPLHKERTMERNQLKQLEKPDQHGFENKQVSKSKVLQRVNNIRSKHFLWCILFIIIYIKGE